MPGLCHPDQGDFPGSGQAQAVVSCQMDFSHSEPRE
jgi:hypothetical protein